MLKKMKKRIKYILTEFIGAAVFLAILYFVSAWLTGYSLLLAYFGNLAVMILSIILEEYFIRRLESKGLPQNPRKGIDKEKINRDIKAIENNISFKTILYFVYIFILVFSQILNAYPTLVGENFGNFILSNSYSILLLVAIDMLIGQVTKDRERMKRLSEKLKESLGESPNSNVDKSSCSEDKKC